MPENSSCRVGVAQRKITPSIGCNLGGYFHRRLGKEVKSDLYAKALVIESQGRTLALVGLDLGETQAAFTRPAKAKIAQTCPIPPEAVLISATHTHTAPALIQRKGVPYDAVPGYAEMLAETIPELVREAHDRLFEATLYCGEAAAEGYSWNKLRRLKNGKDAYPLGLAQGEKLEDIGPSGPLDTSVQVLCARDKDKRVRAFVVNFAAHPNAGPEVIWAEWPGELARTIAAVYGEDVPCLFLQGTAGDVDSARGITREQVGRGIAGAAILAAEREHTPLDPVVLNWRLKSPAIRRLSKTPETERMIAEIRRKPEPSYLEKGWLARYDAWEDEPREVNAPVQCLRIGAVAIVGLPAEIFTAIGLEIKRYSPAEHTLVVELANERVSSYIPPIEQAHRGGYGEWPFISRHLVPEAGTIITDAAIGMLHEIWDGSVACRA